MKGPSPYECAAEIAATHPSAQVMRGIQDSNFQEVRRVTKLPEAMAFHYVLGNNMG
jgi:hypothetical protein